MKEKISYKNFNRDFLEDIQGNILQAHKRKHARHLFLSFGKVKEAPLSIRTWISDLAELEISSCWQEIVTARESSFCAFLLSASGYQSLGLKMPKDQAFQMGMQNRGASLKDPTLASWEYDYKKQTIDAMLIIADDDPVLVAKKIVLLKESLLLAEAEIITEEQGHRFMRLNQEIEHFGFVDGISQPEEKKIPIREIDKEILIEQPKALLVPDSYGGFGSYLVYRKLEQNVKVWEENIRILAKLTDTNPFLAGAWAMGRFMDGTPVVRYDNMQQQDEPENHFNYEEDKTGNACPYHAHTRKMNNRKGSLYPRIARRAMSYGLRPDLHPQGKMFALPETGVGLLFMCFQNNIEEGFEYLQKVANDPDLPSSNAGQDPLISQGLEDKVINSWPCAYKSTERINYAFDRTVSLKGGEYFFAPGLRFLKQNIFAPLSPNATS